MWWTNISRRNIDPRKFDERIILNTSYLFQEKMLLVESNKILYYARTITCIVNIYKYRVCFAINLIFADINYDSNYKFSINLIPVDINYDIQIANSLSFAIQFGAQSELPSKYTTPPPHPSSSDFHTVQFKLHSYTPIFPWHSRKFHTYSELIFRGYSSRINWIQSNVSKQNPRTESCQFYIRIRIFSLSKFIYRHLASTRYSFSLNSQNYCKHF